MTTANVTEFESFARDLAVYACTWTPQCQNKIIKHVREIFEDKTLRGMVERYAELKEASDKTTRYEFIKACTGEDITEVDEDFLAINSHTTKSYREVLDDLIFHAYCH